MMNKTTAFSSVSRPQIPSGSAWARWLPFAILLSLALHIAFLWWTRNIIWRNPVVITPPPPAIRPFRLIKQPELPYSIEKPATTTQHKPPALPVEKMEPQPTIGTLHAEASSSLPKINPALLQEQPGVVGSSLDSTIQKIVSEGNRKAKIDSFQEKPSHSDSATHPLNELLESGETKQAAFAGRRPGSMPQGFSDLDTLLAQTDPLKSGTAPILMPTDLLFDYDRAELRPQAVESLRKLGTLIQRNPHATFLIEGHTDSFGSDAYNMDLSLRRAEAVKNWLVQTMGIQSERIQTKGYGKTRLLAPDSGTVQQQQINRRVEIVIHVPKNVR